VLTFDKGFLIFIVVRVILLVVVVRVNSSDWLYRLLKWVFEIIDGDLAVFAARIVRLEIVIKVSLCSQLVNQRQVLLVVIEDGLFPEVEARLLLLWLLHNVDDLAGDLEFFGKLIVAIIDRDRESLIKKLGAQRCFSIIVWVSVFESCSLRYHKSVLGTFCISHDINLLLNIAHYVKFVFWILFNLSITFGHSFFLDFIHLFIDYRCVFVENVWHILTQFCVSLIDLLLNFDHPLTICLNINTQDVTLANI